MTTPDRARAQKRAIEDELADTVRKLRDATGLSLRRLARRTGIGRSTWSAYQTRGIGRIVSAKALDRLLDLESTATPELKGHARRLRRQLQDLASGRDVVSEADAGPPAGAGESPVPIVINVTTPPPPPPPRPHPKTMIIGIALLACCLLIAVLAAVAYIAKTGSSTPAHRPVTALPPASTTTAAARPSPMPASPEPSRREHAAPSRTREAPVSSSPVIRNSSAPPDRPCDRRRRYSVDEDGDVVDAAKHPIGTVVAGDVFYRLDTASHQAMQYRYYGTIARGRLNGYVLQKKLNYTGTVCVPR